MKSEIKYEDVKIVMMDDGYCEYDRCGVGEVDGKVFVCDLENVDFSDLEYKEVFDDGSELKYFWFVNFDSIEECVKSGVEFGWCREIDWGYNKSDKYRIISGEGDEWVNGEENWFDNWIKENELA